jgi:hypothetical protein
LSGVCFIDTETTGLDPDRHEIWEVGLILPDGTEHEWQLPVDLGRADPIALNIGRFHDRRPAQGTQHYRPWGPEKYEGRFVIHPDVMSEWCAEFVRLTRGLHLAGAVVSFDAERLWMLLRDYHQCPMWHYHLIDVEAMAVGFIRGRAQGIAAAGDITRFPSSVTALKNVTPPWRSDDLSLAVGVDPANFDRHTALGDARWAQAIYEAVMGDAARVHLLGEAAAS